MILLLDNYDSFTFNLYQALAGLGAEVVVRRNDALTADEALSMGASAFVLSPGPGRPAAAFAWRSGTVLTILFEYCSYTVLSSMVLVPGTAVPVVRH